MPTTKKEDFYFGFMMCFGMVLVMTMYNMFLNGLIGVLSFSEIIVQLIIGFIVAFILELFIVGPVARKIAFSLPYDKSKKIYVILSLSLCMVFGMVTLMSLYGLIQGLLSNGLSTNSIVKSYFSIFIKNFILALPLQLVIMGPLVRFIFTKLKNNKTVNYA